MMELNVLNRPSTVNLMISVEKEKIIRIMFGASVRSGELTSITTLTNLDIATERVKAIPALEQCSQNPQRRSSFCTNNWGHCSESIPLGAMHGTRKRPATLYCRTIYLKFGAMSVIPPCAKCSQVMSSMMDMGIVTIYQLQSIQL
ncbi:hypothetical protein RirG_009670 [Rhizophagus irregularis DAOM 197198w]|uniref:Uncharacterized protein n=1 Tax=Rhizophagus irregularis (strain DAOM 197198w) TaxID=1432141 RepID=A0A015M1X6_RHIIW|nr:hypothetical protein RirG_009670 [Rhizophagus irregularis DAOM 197198w]